MEYPSEHYKLIEDLKLKDFIKTKEVAEVMKSTDRKDFAPMLPYEDR